MKELLTDEFMDEATAELYRIANETSNKVIRVIAKRLKKCGTMTEKDVKRLRNIMRISDFKKIEKALAEMAKMSETEVDTIFDKVAKTNEEMAKTLYEYRGVEQLPYTENKVMKRIVNAAQKNAKKDILALSNTTVTGIRLMKNGTVQYFPLKRAYNKIIDEAVLSLNMGIESYNSAIHRVLKQIAGNGVSVLYDSGYTRRLDSAVRMNVLDGCRQMNLAMREQEAEEYGADGWEISAHGLCRPEHQEPQGRVFSKEEFEKLNERLETPIATGEMNCKHIKFGVIMAINQPAYTDEELKKLKAQANEKVKFKSISGEELEKTRYDASQYLRWMETNIRKKRDVRNVLKDAGFNVTKNDNEIKMLENQYKRIADEMGLTARTNRLKM